jgi:hypothetical protein
MFRRPLESIIHYKAKNNEMICGRVYLQVNMEQELQVDQTIVLGDLASTKPKEVSFQIPFLSFCKKSIVLLENALHFYGQHRP